MEKSTLKLAIIEILENRNVLNYHDGGLKQAFLDGTSELPIDQLSIDSLAAMEICIALELDFNFSIGPQELFKFSTLMDLIDQVKESCE